MAVYQFSALPDGQAISFNPDSDVLNFDQTAISAADLLLFTEGSSTRVSAGGKSVVLQSTALAQLAGTNVTFANGSRLLFDDGANSLTGTGGNDLIAGFGGADTMNGGAGNDVFLMTADSGAGNVIDAGTGRDTLYFGHHASGAVSVHLAAGTFSGGGGSGTISNQSVENVVGGAFNDNIVGNAADNRLEGGAGNDVMSGREGNDTLLGGEGNDTFNMSSGSSGDYGNDTIRGGSGRDTVDFGINAQSAIYVHLLDGVLAGGGAGGAGSAVLVSIEDVVGGAFNDWIVGDAAANFLFGYRGDDTLNGGEGNDRLEGHDGDDHLIGYLGADTLTGGLGADRFIFDTAPSAANADRITDFVSGSDKIELSRAVHANLGASGNFAAGDARFAAGAGFTSGRDANDRVIYDTATGNLYYDADGSGSGAAQLVATLQGAPALAATDIAAFGEDSAQAAPVRGTAGPDSLTGGSGNDTIEGRGGDDTIRGLAGDDSLVGGAGDDWLFGGAGNDTLKGGDGWDLLDGGSGNDWLIGGAGGNTFFGRGGNDVLIGGPGYEEFHPGKGDDRVETGGGGSTVFMGFSGLDDSVEYGDDTLVGGAGQDVLHLQLKSAVVVDMRAGTLSGGSQSGDGSVAFSSFEWFGFWGDFSVHFTAADSGGSVGVNGNGNDTLIGGAGNDELFGGGGTNLIIGGAGADTMSSHPHESVTTYVFNTAPGPGEADTIWQFVTGVHSLHFDASVFTALGAAGRFSPDDERFYSAPGATEGHDATDRLIYNSSNGELWYDADGSGAGASVLVATLPRDTGSAKVWSVAASDIWVGSAAAQTIKGTSGNDTIEGLGGDDLLMGMGGDDRLFGGDGSDTLKGGAGDDYLDPGGSQFYPQHENEYLIGGGGNDTLIGAQGDTLDGGLGNDLYDIRWGMAVVVDAGGVDTFIVYDGGTWTLPAGIENLIGGLFESGGFNTPLAIGNALDNLIDLGEFANAHIEGGAGNDTLIGGWHGGDNVLAGGAGNDLLLGSDRADRFVFAENPGGAHADRITDFTPGSDRLLFDNAVLTALGADGDFAADDERFYAAAGARSAHDANDRLIYDTSTGKLYYDADGAGAAAGKIVATLAGAPGLDAADITVI